MTASPATRPSRAPDRAVVLVIGDLARSPRMLYHALALADHGISVDLVGQVGTPLPSAILSQPRITVRELRDAPGATPDGQRWRLVGAGGRGAALAAELLRILLRDTDRPDLILVQNPPGVPALGVACLAARLRSARLVIDWHNLTASMLALRMPRQHPLVRMIGRYEHLMGRLAAGNLGVSSAMCQFLAGRGIRSSVFRDGPADRFAPLPGPARQRVRQRLRQRLELPVTGDFGLALSATSWTADEDFDLLHDALDRCERGASDIAAGRGVTPLLVLLTGRGPRQKAFAARLAARREHWIHARTLWLDDDEYPEVVGAADVGVSLHRSTSGLDLPMKVADYLGAGLPVFALDYGPCLREILTDGGNGRLFATSADLAALIDVAFRDDRGQNGLLERLRRNVGRSAHVSWRERWEHDARPVLLAA
jgi:beta-1,4-mannosyltransferase